MVSVDSEPVKITTIEKLINDKMTSAPSSPVNSHEGLCAQIDVEVQEQMQKKIESLKDKNATLEKEVSTLVQFRGTCVVRTHSVNTTHEHAHSHLRNRPDTRVQAL